VLAAMFVSFKGNGTCRLAGTPPSVLVVRRGLNIWQRIALENGKKITQCLSFNGKLIEPVLMKRKFYRCNLKKLKRPDIRSKETVIVYSGMAKFSSLYLLPHCILRE
jgi:hypothetical protein